MGTVLAGEKPFHSKSWKCEKISHFCWSTYNQGLLYRRLPSFAIIWCLLRNYFLELSFALFSNISTAYCYYLFCFVTNFQSFPWFDKYDMCLYANKKNNFSDFHEMQINLYLLIKYNFVIQIICHDIFIRNICAPLKEGNLEINFYIIRNLNSIIFTIIQIIILIHYNLFNNCIILCFTKCIFLHDLYTVS